MLMQCPVCKEDIKDEAIKCRFCGHVLDKEALQKVTGVQPQDKEKKVKSAVSPLNTIFGKLKP